MEKNDQRVGSLKEIGVRLPTQSKWRPMIESARVLESKMKEVGKMPSALRKREVCEREGRELSRDANLDTSIMLDGDKRCSYATHAELLVRQTAKPTHSHTPVKCFTRASRRLASFCSECNRHLCESSG